MIRTIEWQDNKLRILDQSALPWQERYLELSSYQDVASTIREMKVRGAPAIGIVAAYGIVLGAQGIKTSSSTKFITQLNLIMQTFAATRPTAVNLFHVLARMTKAAASQESIHDINSALQHEATSIHQEEIAASRQLSQFGAELISDGFTILTHCNTGSLATGGYGTALGIIKAAAKQGKKVDVIATETRPLLQGARLTIWELQQEKIPATLITDSMAGYLMHQGKINCVIVGADRIAANGDTANKIGTYSLAVLARENSIPFYVAAPTSTFDLTVTTGEQISIEHRNPDEVTLFSGTRIAPRGTVALNPAFDITPHNYISAIITERGIIKSPYKRALPNMAVKEIR